MRKHIVLVLIVILALMMSGCAPFSPAPPTKAILEGRVVVPEGAVRQVGGQALPGAIVNVIDPVTGNIVATTTTDANGYYRVEVPPGGPYIVEVVKGSIKVLDVSPQVEAGKTYDLGTADATSTAVALAFQARVEAGEDPAEIDLEEIAEDPKIGNLIQAVEEALAAGKDPTTAPEVIHLVDIIVTPPKPAPAPAPTPTYTVTFKVTPADATVVVKDSKGNVVTTTTPGVYKLTPGAYTYTVSKTGYVAQTGKFTVVDKDLTITVNLEALPTITLTPATGSSTVAQGGNLQESQITLSSNYNATELKTFISLKKYNTPVNFDIVFDEFNLKTGEDGPYNMVGAYSTFQYGPSGGYSVTAGVPQVTTITGKVKPDALVGTYTIITEIKDAGGNVLARATYTLIVTRAPVYNVNTGTGYQTIQAAIDEAGNGNTIEVAAGTYTEDVTIGKPLTITGAPGRGATTIKGTVTINATGGGTRIENINFELGTDTQDNIVLNNVSYITITGCNFDAKGRFTGEPNARAIQMNRTCNNITITNCTFKNGYYVTIQGRANNVTVMSSQIRNCKSGINLQAGDNLTVYNTDISVVAQGKSNDTYCVRFAGSNMSITGGKFSVDKNGLIAESGIYHSAIVIREGAGTPLTILGVTINGEVVNLSGKLDLEDVLRDNYFPEGSKVEGNKIVVP